MPVVRRLLYSCLLLVTALAPLSAEASDGSAAAKTVRAGAVTDLSVTVYRSPYGVSESLDLDRLGGFALVTETRTVSIPAGESRIRFEGVADGIQPASAIITGLPTGVLEKNHDAQVLSPSALVKATVGRSIWLVRTDRKTGKETDIQGTLISDSEGVVFQSAAGEIEALRCSGLPETFQFDAATDAPATPTLSALIRSPEPATAQVRLSYLARGFDWMANYVAAVSADGSSIDLGAWVTLGNSNSVSFPDAHAQVVAGRLNRQAQQIEPIDPGIEILAKCWPRGSTSDTPDAPHIFAARPLGQLESVMVTAARKAMAPMPMYDMAIQEVAVTGTQQEQLGDLKLYRVPWRTSVTSRQIKQVRMLDQQAVPVKLIYHADVPADSELESQPLRKVLRTRNDRAHHLGLPLPSGRVAAFYEREGVPLLVNEAPLRDVAVDEEFEIDVGEAPDVQINAETADRAVDPKKLKRLRLRPRVVVRSSEVDEVHVIQVTNARSAPAFVELSVLLPDGATLVEADHVPGTRNGHPTFSLTVPAEGSALIQYRTQEIDDRPGVP
ncbi:MAG TPA: hypothetical protein VNY82_17755 [Steroidobacteraceae bacterium]|nr:hypothetical protein [Steroidobacteraceae bacterium]